MASNNLTISDLLDALCRNLYCDFIDNGNDGVTDGPNTKLIKQCKTIAFEVLLKKSPRTKIENHHNENNDDPTKALRYRQFEWYVEMGLRKSIQIGSYRLPQLDYGGRRNKEQNELMETALEFVEADGDDEIEKMPVVLLLTKLINFAQDRKRQKV